MRRKFKRWLAILTGWAFIALGVAGLFLPFLQGLLFLLIGITILSTEYAWARNILRKLRERFPSFHSRIDAARAWAQERLKRIFSARSDHSQS